MNDEAISRLIQNRRDYSLFEMDKVSKNILWVGSYEDESYNWSLDISSFNESELKVVNKMIQMVADQKTHNKKGEIK